MMNRIIVSLITSVMIGVVVVGPAEAQKGLMVYLTFDEVAGDTAKDWTSNSNDGTLVGGPKWVKGKFGGALEFDGVDDYVFIEQSNTLEFDTGDFTVEGWVNLSKDKLTGTPGGRFANSRGTGAGGTLHGWQVKIINEGADGKWGFMDSGIDDATGNYQAYNPGFQVTTAPYENGQWFHVGVVYTAGTGLSFYVDGELDGEIKINKYGSLDNDLPVAIGAAIAHNGDRGAQLSQFFPGMIDDFRLWSRALSPAELKANMEGFAVEPRYKLATTWGKVKESGVTDR